MCVSNVNVLSIKLIFSLTLWSTGSSYGGISVVLLPTVDYCSQGSVTPLIFICAQHDKQLQLPSVHVPLLLEVKFNSRWVMRFEYSKPFFLSIGHILLEQVRVVNPEVFSDFRWRDLIFVPHILCCAVYCASRSKRSQNMN